MSQFTEEDRRVLEHGVNNLGGRFAEAVIHLLAALDEQRTRRTILLAVLDQERARRTMAEQRAGGEVWYWQGDAEDHLESLTCPIIISPEQLRAAIDDERARLLSAVLQVANAWEYGQWETLHRRLRAAIDKAVKE